MPHQIPSAASHDFKFSKLDHVVFSLLCSPFRSIREFTLWTVNGYRAE